MQDYKLFVRAVWGGATSYDADGGISVQNAAEAQDYLNAMYLSQGYRVVSVDYTGEVAVQPEFGEKSPRAMRFAWHLVKDFEAKKGDK